MKANDKLRDELLASQTSLRAGDEEKRKKEDRLKEVEGELKRLRNEYNKLETQHFHQIRELNSKLNEVSKNLIPRQFLQTRSLPPADVLNLTGASDNSRGFGAGTPAFDNIWDQPLQAPVGRHR